MLIPEMMTVTGPKVEELRLETQFVWHHSLSSFDRCVVPLPNDTRRAVLYQWTWGEKRCSVTARRFSTVNRTGGLFWFVQPVRTGTGILWQGGSPLSVCSDVVPSVCRALGGFRQMMWSFSNTLFWPNIFLVIFHFNTHHLTGGSYLAGIDVWDREIYSLQSNECSQNTNSCHRGLYKNRHNTVRIKLEE